MCVLSVIHMLLPAAIWSSQCHTGAGGFLLCVGTHLHCTTVVTPTVHPGEPLPRLPPNQYKNQGRPQDFELRSPGGNLSFLDISMWKFPCLGGSLLDRDKKKEWLLKSLLR